ncbi:hypothetical protein M0208_16260 [Sphingomonas sp. SUN019]|uniref:hypothetical protein n=1 Tax=Sphingomonas sp. SUN019 TaxID=2937788 RepID=UPI00216429E8|nr:hypothetical protein [Sphingomonas sp. SUN019]UVO51986.1 hypothetical protein M0208_16260 [Sphingomonas sp. SUN019]
MSPAIAAVLTDHSQRLLTRIAPQLTGFDANSVSMIGLMLQMVADQWDGAAAMRVEENRAIRGLFRDAAALVEGSDLGARIAELAAGEDDDLHLNALEATNHALRAALIELHATVEQCADAAAINDAIWAELRRSTDRRRIASANF